MNREYGGVIWTNHAMERLRERNISQSDAWATWRNPDQSRYAKSKEAWIYYKNYGEQRIEVVAKKNDKGKWLILSVWSKSGFSNKTTKNKSLLQLIWRAIKGK